MSVCVCVYVCDAIEPASELASAHSEQTPREGTGEGGRKGMRRATSDGYVHTYLRSRAPSHPTRIRFCSREGRKEGRKEGRTLII